jgi:hypothetical protein
MFSRPTARLLLLSLGCCLAQGAIAQGGLVPAPGAHKYDQNHDGFINAGTELTVYIKHKKWPDLAKVDEDLNGRIDPGAELDMYNSNQDADATLAEDILDAKDTIGSTPGFKVTDAEPKGPDAGIPNVKTGFLLRKVYENISVFSGASDYETAAPALLTYTHDRLDDSDLATIAGSLTVYRRWGLGTPFVQGRSRLTAAAINAGIETEAEFRPDLGWADKSSFTARAGGELERQGSWVSTEYYRANAFLTSDYNGSFGRGGVEVEWEPTNTRWAIGVARRLPGTKLSVRWRPVLHAEYQNDFSGNAPLGFGGQESLLLGPVVSAQAWLDYGFLSRGYLDATYYALFDALEDWRAFDYFEISANYNLDPSRHAALTAKYRVGRTPKVGEEVDEIRVGFGLKF